MKVEGIELNWERFSTRNLVSLEKIQNPEEVFSLPKHPDGDHVYCDANKTIGTDTALEVECI